MELFSYLPAINSFWGLILYSLVAYITSVIVASFVSSYATSLNDND